MRRIGPFDVYPRSCVVSMLAAMTVAACGSQGEGPFGEPPFGQIGFVGSGGRYDGGFFLHDSGTGGPAKDGGSGVDGGHLGDSGVVVDENDGSPNDGGSSVGVVLNLPPGFFATLDWVIEGPAGTYSGTVHFGQARSIEFVVGGIQAGDGYRITLTGVDAYGQPCSGTSAPFSVAPGATTGAGVLILCDAGDGAAAAPVSSGNVAVDAGVRVP